MKKALIFLFSLCLIVSVCARPVAADTTMPPTEKGDVYLQAEVPEGYEDTVYVVFIDHIGRWATIELLYEHGYEVLVSMPFGTYSVSGALPSVYEEDHTVSVSSEMISVGEEAVELNIVVSYHAPEEDPANTTSQPTVPTTEPLPTAPEETISPTETVATEPTEPTEPAEPMEPDTKPSAPSGGEGDSGGEDPDATGDPEATEEKPTLAELLGFNWKDSLVSLLGTAGFVGVVFVCAYLYRKYGTSF